VGSGGLLSLLLEFAQELGLLLAGLESSVSELAGGVDELEGDLLEGVAAGLGQEGLAKSENPLPHTNGAALDHQEVLIHNTILRESSHGGDRFLGQIEAG